MNTREMTERVASAAGFIAALDQSGGSTPKALGEYGIAEDAWTTDEEMFDLVQAMRARIITSPSFSSARLIGAILFERTMESVVDGLPVPRLLSDRGIVPFLKIDRGLEEERDGVRLMKPLTMLEAQLERAAALGIFGTKERSFISAASRAGIRAVLDQQFEVAEKVSSAGLMPIIEPEIDIASPGRAEAEAILQEELIHRLDALPEGRVTMLKLSLPTTPGFFRPLVEHPKVLRVLALSGGYSRKDACAVLARNPGIVASFSRALLEDLRHGMSDAEFDRALGCAVDEIFLASTSKA